MKKVLLLLLPAFVLISATAQLAKGQNTRITFQVNLKVKALEGVFNPVTDSVSVNGSFNDWTPLRDKMSDPAPIDSIYVTTLTLNDTLVGKEIKYKFFFRKFPAGTDNWEEGNDRGYVVLAGSQTLPLVYFSSDSVVSVPVSGNRLFRVEMEGAVRSGFFDPARGDVMEVRGGWNNWGGLTTYRDMTPVPGTHRWELLMPFSGDLSGDPLAYKFFARHNPAAAQQRWANWADWWGWETPGSRGGSDRVHTISGGNVLLPMYYYSDIHPGLIVQQFDSITVTLRMDMRTATRRAIPFRPGTDTLWLVFVDPQFGAMTGNEEPNNVRFFYSDPDRDTIYTLTFSIGGPALAGFSYLTRYRSEQEGGGFAVGRYRARYIPPLGANRFPRNYTFPLDVWQKDPPLPFEQPPFGTFVSVEMVESGIPEAYALAQNYPNPFNPTTTIEYSIPKDGFVSLAVYNILGQEIARVIEGEQAAGSYRARFDASKLTSGVYFYRLRSGSFVDVKKMVLVK